MNPGSLFYRGWIQMRFFKLSNGLAVTASAMAMTFAMGAPAHAQANQPVTPDEAEACADLPTPAERDQCVRAQARPEGTAEEAGDPATQAPGETLERQAETQSIVVTGSRIRRNAFTTPDPLTVIDPELEQRGGRNDVGEIIQSSPVAAGSFQLTPLLTAGGFVTNGGVGAQTVSLRGLGAERTLTLVNGRRAGPAGTRGAIAGFDLNVIPSAAIQSVEILKTGASSIYGSDAIAGVVNLLTRRSTDGLELRGFSSVPLEGGGENYSLSAAYGK
jgi:iron complex outermembrane receptor protein